MADSGGHFGLGVQAALDDIGFVGAAASRWTMRDRIHKHTSAATPAKGVAYVKHHTRLAHDRKRWTVAISNRTGLRHKHAGKNAADHPGISARSYTHARREPCIDRKLRAVFTGNQQAAFLYEILQMLQAAIPQARPGIGC